MSKKNSLKEILSDENKYDTIIIGGGIAGLYTAYKLSLENKSILLIEKNNYLGGRIYTYKETVSDPKTEEQIEIQYEAGAGRFSETHHLLISLIDELGLKNKMKKISNERIPVVRDLKYKDLKYKQGKKKYKEKYKNRQNEGENEEILDISILMKKVIENSYKFDKKVLKEMSIFNLATHVLATSSSQFLFDAFGYDSELLDLNAYDAIRLFSNDFNSDNQYYILSCGLSTICDILEKKILENKNCKILKECLFNDFIYIKKYKRFYIYYENLVKSMKNKLKFAIADNLILAIPKISLLKIDSLKMFNENLNSVIGHDLNRVYALYPRGKKEKVWFYDLPKITTDNPIQYIIPIDKEKGLIMISYSDSTYANYWKQSSDLDTLEKDLARHLKTIFPDREIPAPIFIKCHFWNDGAYFYKPGYDSDINYEKILQPWENRNLFIVGECYSLKQAWIEGALETSNEILKKLI